jgi:hypothetical protein
MLRLERGDADRHATTRPCKDGEKALKHGRDHELGARPPPRITRLLTARVMEGKRGRTDR